MSQKKNGIKCTNCRKWVKDIDVNTHADKHKADWKKKNKGVFPVPDVIFHIIENGEMKGRKLF